MNRCIEFFVVLLALAGTAAFAQASFKDAPRNVRPARMVVTAPPAITLDGKPDQLAPGVRIRGTNNLIVLSGSLLNQSVPVVYRRDLTGQVHEVWILTAQEYAQLRGDADPANVEGHRLFVDTLNLIYARR